MDVPASPASVLCLPCQGFAGRPAYSLLEGRPIIFFCQAALELQRFDAALRSLTASRVSLGALPTALNSWAAVLRNNIDELLCAGGP